jgi:beta-lactamase regulating signal transducer with metallopeptidase domain
MNTQTLLWIAVVIVGLLYLVKRRSRLRSED